MAHGLLTRRISTGQLQESAHGLDIGTGQLVLEELVLDPLSQGLDGLGLKDVFDGVRSRVQRWT